MTWELTPLKAEDFDRAFSQIEKSFIPEERRDREDARELFLSGKYEILLLASDSRDVGFVTVWHLPSFVFLEHFVIYEENRNRGLGTLALSLIKKRYDRLVLEAELPEQEIQKRRIAFYERCGFVQNYEPYIQPPYRKGEKGVPLRLMSYPVALTSFISTRDEIYKFVYKM